MLFSEVELDGTPLHLAKFIDISERTRLYYEEIVYDGETQCGFHALAVTTTGWGCRWDYEGQVPWDDKNEKIGVEIILNATARFDGLRDMWFMDDGYLHHPDLTELRAILEALEKLEDQYCSE